MRLLFWSELFRPDIGGVEVWSTQLIHALQRRGHECLAIAGQGPTSLPERTTFEGIAARRFSFHAALLQRDLAAIKRLALEVAALKREFRPDVIHINTSQPSVLFHEKSAAAADCAVVFTVHEPPILQARNSMLARLLQSADWVVGISQAMLDDARSLVPEIAPRSCVIHNAVDEESADVAPLGTAARELVFVGRLVKEKGVDLAIRAFAELHSAYPDLHMTIAGDGPEHNNLQSLAAQLGVAESVLFAGWVAPQDVSTLLQTACIVLMPSRWREPFGLVALQAAEAGRPVIAARVGGLAEIVVDGVTGLLVTPEDSAALGAAIRSLLDSPAAAARMGMAAREHKRRQFDYGAFVSAYEQLYERVSGARAARGMSA